MAGILPIGFFMPLPLAMMIPFMGIQSAVMMKQAGENWQYGKRRISAMSNEDFNALTPLKMLQNSNEEVKSMIPSMKQSIIDIRQFQDFIIVEIIELMRRGLETGLGAIFGLTPEQSNAFFGGTQGINQPIDDTSGTQEISNLMNKSPSEIKSWSNNYLKQQNARLDKYTPSTRQHIQTEYQRRFGTEEPSFTPNIDALKEQEKTNTQIDEIIITAPVKKRRAGQSQILERNKLIKIISNLGLQIKRLINQLRGARASEDTTRAKILLENSKINLNTNQIKLATLLTRYQF